MSDHGTVSFESALTELLPSDLPHRDHVISGCALHLARIVETNQQFNLTRIVEEREAVIKHVVDSVTPWRLFSGAARIADAGTGPGFPGIPLALVFPEARFTLLESTQKKARFVEAVAAELKVTNVRVRPDRAETWLAANKVDIVTARAVAPLAKAIELFGPALRGGARLLLYKGPDAESEIAEAKPEIHRRRVKVRVCLRYELPEQMGSRTIVEVKQP